MFFIYLFTIWTSRTTVTTVKTPRQIRNHKTGKTWRKLKLKELKTAHFPVDIISDHTQASINFVAFWIVDKIDCRRLNNEK